MYSSASVSAGKKPHRVSEIRRLTDLPTRMPVCNNRVGVIDVDGKKLIYGVTYSSEGKSAILLVDPETGSCDKHGLPGNENGAQCDVAGIDGKLYLGFISGRLQTFDPWTSRFEELAHPFPGEYMAGGETTPSGFVILGSYPDGKVGDANVTVQYNASK